MIRLELQHDLSKAYIKTNQWKNSKIEIKERKSNRKTNFRIFESGLEKKSLFLVNKRQSAKQRNKKK
mgnify:FL=1